MKHPIDVKYYSYGFSFFFVVVLKLKLHDFRRAKDYLLDRKQIQGRVESLAVQQLPQQFYVLYRIYRVVRCLRLVSVVLPPQTPWRRQRRRAWRPPEAERAAHRAPVHSVRGKPAFQHGAGRHRRHLQRAQHPQRAIGQRQRDRQVQR